MSLNNNEEEGKQDNVNHELHEDSIPEFDVVLAIVSPTGKIGWVISNSVTDQQSNQIRKIIAITNSPWIVLSLFLYIEMLFLDLEDRIKFFFKRSEDELDD